MKSTPSLDDGISNSFVDWPLESEAIARRIVGDEGQTISNHHAQAKNPANFNWTIYWTMDKDGSNDTILQRRNQCIALTLHPVEPSFCCEKNSQASCTG